MTSWQPIDSVPKDQRVLTYWPNHPQGREHEVRTAMFPKNYPMKNVAATLWAPLHEPPNGYEIVSVTMRKKLNP